MKKVEGYIPSVKPKVACWYSYICKSENIKPKKTV